ncbi:nucleotidyltransferase family protein [Bacillus infantis]|uniref:Nucleotidyltransferase family protein n=1 Tax=Bacillus infantis TaxID=324767 RepID=A0A5D4SD21_9BACI|nr:nucleotidyltransferase family protein [Bacillus infantis]TYS60561.1 nucleotidyltransferase family protein [Bacillus infantis]
MSKKKSNIFYDICRGIFPTESNVNLKCESLSTIAKKHRLIYPLLKYNKDLRINNLSWEDVKKIENIKQQHLKELITNFSLLKINFMLIKGIALKKYYPHNVPRQSIDYDFIIKTIEDFFVVYNYLKELGYEYEGFPLFSEVEGKIYGIVKMEKDLGNGLISKLEFNVGGFLISEVTWLDEDILFDNSEYFELNDTMVLIPNSTMNYIILVIEVGGNPYDRIRDSVDYFFLRESINTPKAQELINKYNLKSFEKRLLTAYKLIEQNKFNNNKPKSLLNDIKVRLLKDQHILPYLIKNRTFNFKFLFNYYMVVLGNYLIYKKASLTFIKKIDNLVLTINRFRSGILTNFVPINDNRINKWKEKKLRKNLIIYRNPFGTFFLSNFCVHEQEEIDFLEKSTGSLL